MTNHERRSGDAASDASTGPPTDDALAVRFDRVNARSDVAVAAMTSYFEELDRRFPDGFDEWASLDEGAAVFDPPDGAFLVVRLAAGPDGVGGGPDGAGVVVGCGGVLTLGPCIGEIKRMWIDPGWRGRGLARRLLAELEGIIAGLGHDVVRLDTNAVLVEAIAMYERAGYVAIDRYNDNPYAERWFEKRLGR
ncbi:MAG: GNAT family N-acetyltransferase [Actinomycetota bacterium]